MVVQSSKKSTQELKTRDILCILHSVVKLNKNGSEYHQFIRIRHKTVAHTNEFGHYCTGAPTHRALGTDCGGEHIVRERTVFRDPSAALGKPDQWLCFEMLTDL